MDDQGVGFGPPGGKIKLFWGHPQDRGAAGTGVFQNIMGFSALEMAGRRIPKGRYPFRGNKHIGKGGGGPIKIMTQGIHEYGS
jgi:hypothetical protein